MEGSGGEKELAESVLTRTVCAQQAPLLALKDKLIIWQLGPGKLNDFHDRLNRVLYWSSQGSAMSIWPLYIYHDLPTRGIHITLIMEAVSFSEALCTRLHSVTFQKRAVFILICLENLKSYPVRCNLSNQERSSYIVSYRTV